MIANLAGMRNYMYILQRVDRCQPSKGSAQHSRVTSLLI
jgi:hypothetical protein